MTKQWVMLLWFVSGLGLLCVSSLALDDNAAQEVNPSFLLKQDDLTNPAAITAWLKQYADTTDPADRQMAQRLFDMGVESQNRDYWSRAVKAFGESALHFPTPTALQHSGDNQLRSLARFRARTNDTTEIHEDLSHVLAIYRSALAAEEQLKMLSESESAQLKADIDCLSEYLAENPDPKEVNIPTAQNGNRCRPLTLYQW